MSASVCWRPVRAGKCAGKSALKKVLESAFQQLPIVMTQSHLNDLHLMVRVTDSDDLNKELTKIIDAIETHGEIEVYVEY